MAYWQLARSVHEPVIVQTCDTYAFLAFGVLLAVDALLSFTLGRIITMTGWAASTAAATSTATSRSGSTGCCVGHLFNYVATVSNLFAIYRYSMRIDLKT